MKIFFSKQFIKFLFVGGFSALVNIVSRVGFNIYMSYVASIIAAFFVALTTAFILNKYMVFEKSQHKNWQTEYKYFFYINLLGLIQTLLISIVLVKYFHFTELVSHSIGVIFPVFTSFVGHKYFSFRSLDVQK